MNPNTTHDQNPPKTKSNKPSILDQMNDSVQQLGCGSPHHTFIRMAEIQNKHETDVQISIIKWLVSLKLWTPSTSVNASNSDARVIKENSNVPAQFLLVRRWLSNISPIEVVPCVWIMLKEPLARKKNMGWKLVSIWFFNHVIKVRPKTQYCNSFHTYAFNQPQI